MLTCLNPLAIHLYSLACLLWYSPLAEYDMCSRLFIYCIYTTRIAAQTWRLMMSTRHACHQSAACGVPFWRSAASCSLWWYVVETLGHVMVLILSFTLWHCIWYSLSHYVCVTRSWRTCSLCIRVCLQIRVWHKNTRPVGSYDERPRKRCISMAVLLNQQGNKVFTSVLAKPLQGDKSFPWQFRWAAK
jgi:hypothetical protein